MELTKEAIQKLGFTFTDYDSETDMDYTFEKKVEQPKNCYLFLVWQPVSNEITVSRHLKPYMGSSFKIERLYRGRLDTIEELKEILKNVN